MTKKEKYIESENKIKYIQMANAKGISLENFFYNKYSEYKSKYLESINGIKNMSGGKYVVGEKDSNNLVGSELTLINAHGSIDINKWYAVPENVYILTTADIGGITCGNYNQVFKKLTNDTKNRDNLKELLGSISNKESVGHENKIVKHIYQGGNIIYEPGDLIPQINLGFHHSQLSNSAKLIYGVFNFDPIKLGDNSKTKIFQEYDNLLKTGNESEQIERLNKFAIGTKFNKNRLINLIKKLKKRNQPEPINFETAFTEFIVGEKYKKFIAQPTNIDFKEIRDEEDNKFITMIMTLYFKTDDSVNKYYYSIKDLVDQLDKSKPNLIVLTSCLHTKNLYMRLFNAKSDKIPQTLAKYNEITGLNQKSGVYFENNQIFPEYEVTQEEVDNTKRFLAIYKNWEANKEEITNILEDEITSSVFDSNGYSHLILAECIALNLHQVMKLLRTNIKFRDEDIKSALIKILKRQSFIKSNEAFMEFFKFKLWKNPELQIEYKPLYVLFDGYGKKNLWDVLVTNRIEWYSYNKYNPSSNISIIVKLLDSQSITFDNEEDRFNLIKLYFSNSTFNLLDHLMTNMWGISQNILNNLEKFEEIIVNNIDKSNLVSLIINCFNSDDFFNQIINILYKNKLLELVSGSQLTDLLIELYRRQFFVRIEKFKNLFEKLKLIGGNINGANSSGYNFYSYIVATHKCSIARTKFELDRAREDQKEYIRKEIEKRENNYQEIISSLKSNGFINNNREIQGIPEDFSGLPWELIIDNVKCTNYYG